MTDNEIIKALECCAEDEWRCNNNCPFFEKCSKTLMAKSSLDIITRQQAEIERLKIENQSLRGAANSYKIHYDEARAEAVKEFADRLKKECIIDRGYEILQEGTIDNLVKEMAGDTE